METGDRPSGVLLAIAIVLLWLAGVCFFVAFEGAAILGGPVPTSGGGASWLRAITQGLTQRTQELQDQNTGGGTG